MGVYFHKVKQRIGHEHSPENGNETLIYLVDDEPLMIELASAILSPLGITLEAFRGGAPALQAYVAARRPPDLVITDYAMPDMDGLSLLQACRRLHPGQKILMLSGTVDESICRDVAAKPDLFLAKPFDPPQLRSAVKALLDN